MHYGQLAITCPRPALTAGKFQKHPSLLHPPAKCCEHHQLSGFRRRQDPQILSNCHFGRRVSPSERDWRPFGPFEGKPNERFTALLSQKKVLHRRRRRFEHLEVSLIISTPALPKKEKESGRGTDQEQRRNDEMEAAAAAPICQAGKDRGWIRRKEGWQTIVLPGAGERAILLAMFAHSRPSDACLSQTERGESEHVPLKKRVNDG